MNRLNFPLRSVSPQSYKNILEFPPTFGTPAGLPAEAPVRDSSVRTPRLGFVGVGWIGRNRLEAIAKSGLADIAVIADPIQELAAQAAKIAPGAIVLSSLDETLAAGIDGLVIATPSALHAEQARAALERGVAVFCQKPLGRTADETCRVIDTARTANRLLGVDLSYRFLEGMRQIHGLIERQELGKIFAADLVFHNAYGPDKPWFYDRQLSGGGCVIDLGIHLVDLALWALDYPLVVDVSSRLFAHGELLDAGSSAVEDYCTARIDLADGGVVNLACSWNLPAGRDAIIQATFYGTEGGASVRNVDGSYYHFVADRFKGTAHEILAVPPDDWGGRAAVEWTRRLAAGETYDPEIERMCDVAGVLDGIYGR